MIVNVFLLWLIVSECWRQDKLLQFLIGFIRGNCISGIRSEPVLFKGSNSNMSYDDEGCGNVLSRAQVEHYAHYGSKRHNRHICVNYPSSQQTNTSGFSILDSFF